LIIWKSLVVEWKGLARYWTGLYLAGSNLDQVTEGAINTGVIDVVALDSWITKRFGFVSPVRQELRNVEVKIDVTDLDDIVDAYGLEVDRKYMLTKIANALDLDLLKRYLITLLALRIDLVTREKKMKEYDLRRLSVPSFVAVYLLGIGIVEDHEYGLLLKPTYDRPDNLLSPEEMVKMATLIRALRDAFRPVDFPMMKEGNLEFMSKFTLNLAVKSYRPRDHVVSAFLSSVIAKTIRDEVVLAISTVNYGDATVFRREIPISEVEDAQPNLEARKPKDEVVPQPLGV